MNLVLQFTPSELYKSSQSWSLICISGLEHALCTDLPKELLCTLIICGLNNLAT